MHTWRLQHGWNGGRGHSTAGVGMGHTYAESLVLIEGLLMSVRYTPGGLTPVFTRGTLRGRWQLV